MKFIIRDKKKIEEPKKKFNWTWLWIRIVIILFVLSWCIYGIINFINIHTFRTPILFQNPIPLKVKIIPSPKTVQEMSDEEYICQKFGDHCKIAVAIAKAESGLRSDAVHQNNNGTIDIGCWQVNSIHLKDVSIATLIDCKKATDWIYDNLYLDQGFQPWTVYTNGSYKEKL